MRRKTGGTSEYFGPEGARFEVDAVTPDALIQVKRVQTAIDKPKNFLNKATRRQIKRTLGAAGDSDLGAHVWALCVTHIVDGKKIGSRNRLSQLVRDYINAADIGKKGSCHVFRHTMATLMLEGGADVRWIQAMLGHARLDTTAIYTQVSIRQLMTIHAATHPGARLERPEGRVDGPTEGNADEALEGPEKPE